MTLTTRTFLLCDDDKDLSDALKEQFSLYEEFTVLQAFSVREALEIIKNHEVDLMILDVDLPDMNGREALKLLRKQGFSNPVIMLTGHDTDADTILGLEAGANDYVTKPFRFNIVLARIRAHLRQFEQSEEATFQIGPFLFRPSAKLLTDDKANKIRLTEKETAILKYLYKAGGKMVARDTLLHEVWGYNAAVTTHTLETHVYRLRQKLQLDRQDGDVVLTDKGGYRLAMRSS
jgi:DNA-binding response OmpR family regulator